MRDDTLSSREEDDRPLDEADLPRPPPAWQAWFETALLAALATAVGIGAHVGPAWLALAPLLAAMRYGSFLGVACAAAQVTALIVGARWRTSIDLPAAQAILGWLIAGLVPGQFRDAWSRRLHRLETRARDAHRRLGGLARAYHVLAASHDRLQRAIPGSPSSLRDALEAFARDVVGSDAADAGAIESLGGRILTLFRVHASVHAASVHPLDREGGIGPAVAALGTGAAHADDPLMRQAVRLGEVVSVRDRPDTAGTLVAVPLADVAGRVHGVVAVRELPFLSLHEETLTLFAVLGGHLGDLLARAHDLSRAAVRIQPSRAFCASVSRSLFEARRYGIPAALAIVELEPSPGMHHVPRLPAPTFPSRARERVMRGDPVGPLARCVAAHRRATDDAEIVADGDGTLRIVILLKLAGAAGLPCYLARTGELARARARELGARCHIRLRGWSLDDAPLPSHPRELEAGLATLLRNAAPARTANAPSSGTPPPRRHHGIVA